MSPDESNLPPKWHPLRLGWERVRVAVALFAVITIPVSVAYGAFLLALIEAIVIVAATVFASSQINRNRD